ncbi:hypothetical protein C1645_769119 [Glomus cerebriforme]|uniref:F-box domain-containing protein n=1 Tax=Glomus cerebriforme TaxID=658196 RepID=A0A397T3E9_9GLOM|nr:hypothetical protein C1645_769119 [Glomus cerebriforme]
MASKLPVECLRKIFEELIKSDLISEPFTHNDAIVYSNLNHLYSCILVNRTWCTTAIPLLWKDPMHWLTVKNNNPVKQVIVPWKDQLHLYIPSAYARSGKLPLLISTYFACLPEKSRRSLKTNKAFKVPEEVIETTTYFDYPFFLRRLNLPTLINAVSMWSQQHHSTDELFDEDTDSEDVLPADVLTEKLIKMFLERSVNLTYLSYIKLPISLQNDVGHIKINIAGFPGSKLTLSKITSFHFNACALKKPEKYYQCLARICHSIENLEIRCLCNDSKGLAALIGSQQGLVKLLIHGGANYYGYNGYISKFNYQNITRALLKKVRDLTYLNFQCTGIPLETFASCTKLEQLLLDANYYQNVDKFIKSDFSHLKSLFIKDGSFLIDHQITIIQNSGGFITEIVNSTNEPRDPDNLTKFYETVIEFCPKLTTLEYYICKDQFSLVPILFNKCNQLQKLTLHSTNLQAEPVEINDVLSKMGEEIPEKLQRIDIPWHFTFSADSLESFLEGCQKRLKEPLRLEASMSTDEHQEILEQYVSLGVLRNNPSKFIEVIIYFILFYFFFLKK